MIKGSKSIYFGKDGKIFGPFTQQEFQIIEESGEIKKYAYIWNYELRAWQPIESPPADLELDSPDQLFLSWTTVEGVCYGPGQIISGKIENVTDGGCDLVARHMDDMPRLGLTSKLVLNVVDPIQNQAMNVATSLIRVSRHEGNWIYHLAWAQRPFFRVVYPSSIRVYFHQGGIILKAFGIFGLLLLISVKPMPLFASDKANTQNPESANSPDSELEEVDIGELKKNYWARGSETEVSVVQNRVHRRRHRIELGILGGNVNGDPFLSIYTFGASIGFHLSESFALYAAGCKTYVRPSSALKTYESTSALKADTNAPSSYFEGGIRGNLIYGKLSLLGAAILYFDSYLFGSVGQISTETGNNTLMSAGAGEQIHLSRTVSANVEFKVFFYRETILSKNPTSLGQSLGARSNLSTSVVLSLSFLLDPFNADKGNHL